MFRPLACACLLLLPPSLLSASQPQFWRIGEASDFLEGELGGLSVDSGGRVRLAPAVHPLHDPESPFVWCLAQDAKGAIYAGTGNEGKVFKVQDGKASLYYDAPELEVHALAIGPDGRLYVATSPDGKVYAVDEQGRASVFFDPADRYIWAIAFDAKGNLLVATGLEARVYRVDTKGAVTTLLTSSDTHILSLAVDARGLFYAGSAPSGILFRVDPAGKVFVVHDSAFHEVRAIDLGADGSIYAALVDGKDKEDSQRPAAPTPAGPGPQAELTVTESVGGPPPGPGMGSPPASATAVKGAVVRIPPGGEIDTLWSSAEETPHALVWTSEGALVGTGAKGKLYRVGDDRTWSMLSVLPAEQLTGLLRRTGGGAVVAASNPGKIFGLEATSAERGTFLSKAKDAETVAAWGRISWEAEQPPGTGVQLETRSGNTQSPDATWSDWSAPAARPEGQPVASEHARFLQVRATLVGKGGSTPVLESITTAYLQRNLRPQVQAVSVHPPGEVFQKPLSVSGEPEVLGLETPPAPVERGAPGGSKVAAPPATAFSRKLYQKGLQTFSWRAEDANNDTLSFDVYLRGMDESRFRLLRKGLSEPVLAWDTATVPNGRYLIKVVASDAPSNPSGMALSGEKESRPFDVDNTPPVVAATLVQKSPPRIRATAKDDASVLRRAEYSVDGGRWQEVFPVDGINDSREEAYEIAIEPPAGPGPHVVVVRASDQLGNVASAKVEVP